MARGRGIWALGDQALISGTNFATMILVARAVNNPTQFGYYGNVNSALLFAALLMVPLVQTLPLTQYPGWHEKLCSWPSDD